MRPPPGSAVRDGVRGELQHRLSDPVRVQRHDSLRRVPRPPTPCRRWRRPSHGCVGQLRDDRPAGSRGSRHRPPLASPVMSVTRPAIRSTSSMTSLRDARTSAGSFSSISFEVSAHDRERRLQLVPDVAQQLSLGGHRAVEAVEHPVDRTGELRDVVVADHRDAFAQVGRGDPVGRVRQRTDGAQQAAGDEPAHDPHDQERDGCDDRVGGERIRQRLKLRGQVDGDDEDAAPAVGRHADRGGDVAQGPPIRRPR